MARYLDRDIIAGFVEEVEEYLPKIHQGLEHLRQHPTELDGLEEIHRVTHSIKGAASMVGLTALSHIAFFEEEALEDLASGKLKCTPAVIELLQNTAAQIEAYIGELMDGTLQEAAVLTTVVQWFRRLRNQPESGDEAEIRALLGAAGEQAVSFGTAAPQPGAELSPELLQVFRAEADEQLQQVSVLLREFERDPTKTNLLADVQRIVHTLKGAANMTGLHAASHLSHRMEDMLERIVEGSAAPSPDMIAVLYLTADTLGDLAATGDTGQAGDLLSYYDILLNGESSGPAAAPTTTQEEAEVEEIPADLIETFRQEAEEHLQLIAEAFREIEAQPANMTALQEVRRSMHTLKGAAGMVGLKSLGKLAHRSEDLLDRMHEDNVPATPEIIALLQATADLMDGMSSGRAGQDAQVRLHELYAAYDGMLGSTERAQGRAADEPETGDVAIEDVPRDILETFQEEAGEHLRAIGEALRQLETNPPGAAANQDLLQDVRRSMHTLKGAAGMVGLRTLSKVAHRSEDLLDRMNDDDKPATPEILNLLHASADIIEMLAGGASGSTFRSTLVELYGQYDLLLGEEVAAPRPHFEPLEQEHAFLVPAPVPEQPAEPSEGASQSRSGQFIRVPIERLDELVRLVAELVVSRSTFEQHLENYARERSELELSLARLKRISGRLETVYEVSALQGGFGTLAVRGVVNGKPIAAEKSAPKNIVSGGAHADDFDALEFDRYTDFHLMSRELAESASDISASGGELSRIKGDFDGYLNRLGRLTSEFQDKLMRLRMVPLRTIASRLHRTVRMTASNREKQVDLVLEGEAIELDKTVLEDMVGPLDHLLRNAVDHGIESVENRLAAGKSERGKIVLRASNEGTEVVIRISDDGGGINPEAVRAAAVRTGFIRQHDADALNDEELYDLIFHPGFTTAREVSEVSGRGVGMDVVKSTVLRRKGSIAVETAIGKGTTFTIRLPLTLGITRVLLVKASNEILAIPLSTVTQILRIERGQIEQIGGRPVLRMDSRLIPANTLGDLLKLRHPPDHALKRIPVLILTIGDRKMAVMVDELIEAREVVVKTLGQLLRRVPGISGATLMGDGRVVLIVNPADLVDRIDRRDMPARAPVRVPETKSRLFDVMIVDDSLSVRRVISNLIKNTGWNPIAAKDGVEALEILERSPNKPDVILMDIEMPRMDGYELTATLRGQETYRRIPIVMLTSRSGDKHRNKAFEVGVTDYLVKPYQDETLLSVIRRVVRESRMAQLR